MIILDFLKSTKPESSILRRIYIRHTTVMAQFASCSLTIGDEAWAAAALFAFASESELFVRK